MRGPNMSYCMCENTLGALEQVMEALREQGPEEFFSQMSSYEREAFNNLVSACKEFVELLTKNAPKATVHEIALGKGQGAVALEIPPDNTGMAKVVRGVAGSIQMLPLDHYHFDNVDFIKIDVEGYELDVIKGGIETLRKNDPVIIVEQKEKHAPPEEGPHAAVRFLMRELKYKVVDRVVDDWILRKL